MFGSSHRDFRCRIRGHRNIGDTDADPGRTRPGCRDPQGVGERDTPSPTLPPPGIRPPQPGARDRYTR